MQLLYLNPIKRCLKRMGAWFGVMENFLVGCCLPLLIFKYSSSSIHTNQEVLVKHGAYGKGLNFLLGAKILNFNDTGKDWRTSSLTENKNPKFKLD